MAWRGLKFIGMECDRNKIGGGDGGLFVACVGDPNSCLFGRHRPSRMVGILLVDRYVLRVVEFRRLGCSNA